jgi:hypothetical protein
MHEQPGRTQPRVLIMEVEVEVVLSAAVMSATRLDGPRAVV